MGPWMWLAGCTGDGMPPLPAVDFAYSLAPAYRVNPHGALYVGFVDLVTNEPSTVTIMVDDGVDRRTFREAEAALVHQVQVSGLRPGTAHRFEVVAQNALGEEITALTGVSTLPLPDDFPPLVVTSNPARMEPGITLLDTGPYLAMVDAQGVVRWAYRSEKFVHTLVLTERDTILYQIGKNLMGELALSGEVLGQWKALPGQTGVVDGFVAVDVEAIHHDVVELPNGNFLTLSVETQRVEDYPSSETNRNAPTRPSDVVGDVVVEFDRAGTVVRSWSLLDRLDPTRVCYDSVRGNYWETLADGDVKDWSHGNAIWYDTGRNEIVVGMRHQDGVVALDADSGDVTWVFAPAANWSGPVADKVLAPADGAALVPYHMHSAKITPAGTLMMFDNGNNRASAFEMPLDEADNDSRGLEVALDLQNRTWSTVWEFGSALEPSHYAGSLGDADPLDQTGNVLVTFGSMNGRAVGAGTRVVEVVRGTDEIVFDLVIPDRDDIRANVYRAERIRPVILGN